MREKISRTNTQSPSTGNAKTTNTGVVIVFDLDKTFFKSDRNRVTLIHPEITIPLLRKALAQGHRIGFITAAAYERKLLERILTFYMSSCPEFLFFNREIAEKDTFFSSFAAAYKITDVSEETIVPSRNITTRLKRSYANFLSKFKDPVNLEEIKSLFWKTLFECRKGPELALRYLNEQKVRKFYLDPRNQKALQILFLLRHDQAFRCKGDSLRIFLYDDNANFFSEYANRISQDFSSLRIQVIHADTESKPPRYLQHLNNLLKAYMPSIQPPKSYRMG